MAVHGSELASYVGCRMRLACASDFASSDNPDGIALPRPTLRRSTHVTLDDFAAELELGVTYCYMGLHDQMLVFVDARTQHVARMPASLGASSMWMLVP